MLNLQLNVGNPYLVYMRTFQAANLTHFVSEKHKSVCVRKKRRLMQNIKGKNPCYSVESVSSVFKCFLPFHTDFAIGH